MSVVNKAKEVDEARIRVEELRKRGLPAAAVAQRMAAEFHLCIYAVRSCLWASFYEGDKIERTYYLGDA